MTATCAGCSNAARPRRPATAGAGWTERSSTSRRAGRPNRHCGSARSWRPRWPRCARRERGSWRRPTALARRSSAICTTARSSASSRWRCGCRCGWRDRDLSPADRAGLDDVLVELRAGLAELRDLAHGLHPAVLSDRGLAHALSSLANRATVPVELTVDLPDERLPIAIEAAAYFTVCEALTNVAKYADADPRVGHGRAQPPRTGGGGRGRRRGRRHARLRFRAPRPARSDRRRQRDAADRERAGRGNRAAGWLPV